MIEFDISTRVERLVSQGHHPERARTIAMTEAAAGFHRAINREPTETEQLADRVRAGNATIVQLADKIAADERVDRNSAFVMAERMLRAR